MATLNGVGLFVVKGIHGNVAFTGAVSIDSTKSKVTGVDLSNDFSLDEFRDGLGNTLTAIAGESQDSINVDFVIHSASGSTLAQAKANITLPDPLGKVTLASFGNSRFDGDWNYVGGGSISKSESIATLKMTLKRWPSITADDPDTFSA